MNVFRGKFELLALTKTKLNENRAIMLSNWHRYRFSGEGRDGHSVKCVAHCSGRIRVSLESSGWIKLMFSRVSLCGGGVQPQ